MRLSTIHYVTVGQLLAVLLSLLMCQQSFAQRQVQAKPPDKGIEAAGYLAQADRELTCAPESAKNWAKKALDTLGSARETDPTLRDMLGDLKSQSNLKVAAADKQIALLAGGAKSARASIREGRLLTAASTLRAADPQGCYSGYKAWLAELSDHERQAAGYVRQGEEIVESKPKNALSLYESAGKINNEYAGLQEKKAHANDVELNRPKKHTGRTVAIWLVLLAGLGAAFYFGCRNGGCKSK
jgi:hypothetical protein